jgi:Uma2 family endonuclease
VNLAVLDAADVAMVVEIVSPGSVAADRAIKPRLYAEAGIPHYVRVELAGPTAILGRLAGERYELTAADQVLRMREPFPLDLDLPSLVSAERA